MSYVGDKSPITSLRDEQGLFYRTITEASRLMEGMPKGSFLAVTSQVTVDLNCPEGTSLRLTSHDPDRVVDHTVVSEEDGSRGIVRRFIHEDPLDIVRLRASLDETGLVSIQMQGEPRNGLFDTYTVCKKDGLRGLSLLPHTVDLHEA